MNTRPGAQPIDEDRVAAYVETGLEQLERGETVDPHELCADAPELAAIVAEALGLATALPEMQKQAHDVDRFVGVELKGRYRLLERIGAGAMGAVYRAHDLELGRAVAVKLMSRELFAGHRAEERFLRESEVLAEFELPQVVRVYDRGRSEDGVLFLVMELLSGAPLSVICARANEVMPEGPDASVFAQGDWYGEFVPNAVVAESSFLRQTVRWCAELAEGLAAVHARGICHRDVKPSNVFVKRDGQAVLLDFGIAVRVGEGHLTATGTSVGTPWYMPPELAAGVSQPDPRSDVYSLAATLYHLLTLAPPFEGDGVSVFARLVREEPTPVQRRHVGLSRDLQAIVERGMVKEPRLRYADMTAFANDLRAFLGHRPVSVRPLGAVGRTWRATRRAPARSLAIAATVVAVVLFAVVIPLWRSVEATARQATHDVLVARVPALLTIEGYPDYRRRIGVTERRSALLLLDEILDLSPRDTQTRILRASVHLDMGEHDQAASDLEAMCASFPDDDYLTSVAGRYRDVNRDDDGITSLDLSALPEPESSTACFVAGFHAMRTRTSAGMAASLELLTRAGDYPPAQDLRLIALQAGGQHQSAHDEAFRLEGVYGRKTARTRHIIGASLVSLGRWDEALEPLRDAIRLGPGRHGPLQNLGIAMRRLGHYDRAIELFEQAHAIRPWLWNTLYDLAIAKCALGQFDEAVALGERIPSSGSLGEEWRRPYVLARVCQEQAFAPLNRGDADAAEQARGPAREANAWFRQALANLPSEGKDARYRGTLEASIALCDAMATGDYEEAVALYANKVAKAPDSAVHLGNLAVLLPEEEWSELTREWIRLILYAQSAARAPADPRRRAWVDQQVERLMQLLPKEKK